MATLDQPVFANADIDENIAAEAFDKTEAFAGSGWVAGVRTHRALRQQLKELPDQLQALLDLADTNPHSGIDVTVVAHRRLELEHVVGRIANGLARIEGAARGASDIPAGAESARERRRKI